MVLFSVLVLIALMLVLFAVCGLAIGGTAFFIMFADVIVCVGIIVLIVRALMKRKKK